VACELLAVHQTRGLGATPDAGAEFAAVLDAVAERLPQLRRIGRSGGT
jgi:hypothetical protein